MTSLLDIPQSHGLFSSYTFSLLEEQQGCVSTALSPAVVAAEAALAQLTPAAALLLLCGHTAGCAHK